MKLDNLNEIQLEAHKSLTAILGEYDTGAYQIYQGYPHTGKTMLLCKVAACLLILGKAFHGHSKIHILSEEDSYSSLVETIESFLPDGLTLGKALKAAEMALSTSNALDTEDISNVDNISVILVDGVQFEKLPFTLNEKIIVRTLHLRPKERVLYSSVSFVVCPETDTRYLHILRFATSNASLIKLPQNSI